MKLMQLNIWGGKLQYQIPDLINEERPDIVCMQEVHDLPGPSGAVFVTLDELKEKCGFAHGFMSASYTSHYQNRENNFGNAILSKYPFTGKQTIFTSGAYKDNFDLTQDDYNVRNLQHATIQYEGQTINILNHHGFLVLGSKLGNNETMRQTQLITDYLAGLHGPLLMTGDFNMSPASDSIKHIGTKLRNLPVEYGLQSTYSQFNIHKEVCDYIFVNDHVTVTNFYSPDALVSDHRPLIVEFSV